MNFPKYDLGSPDFFPGPPIISTPRSRETFSQTSPRSTPVAQADSLSSSWLDLFPAEFRSVITGSMNNSFSRTVSTSDSGSPVSQFTSIVSGLSGKSFVSFDKALTQHLQSGGTGNVFYDPVMHYDLSSMKDKFEVVNEEAGIYQKDGVLYAKKDLGDSAVLQPIGIQKTSEEKYEAVGLSTDLSEVQLEALKGILTALGNTKGDLEDAIKKANEEAAASKEEESSSTDTDGVSAPPPANSSTH